MSARRVCVLVEAGDQPGRNPLVPALRDELGHHEVGLVTWDPTKGFPLPPSPPAADLYLLKGDHPLVLTAAGCLADEGAPCLNTFDATAAAADKARTHARLVRAGVPVPGTWACADPGRARQEGGRLRFAKPVRGAHGEGVTLLVDGAPVPDGPGAWLVQDAVVGDGFDLKVYGVNRHTAVRRVRTAPGVVDSAREVVPDPDPALGRWAVAAAEACGLTCFGADFVVGPDGPLLVDVNAFPGYRSVEEAGRWVTEAVIEELGVTG